MIKSTTEHASPYYESIEFNVNTGTTDYDVDTSQATFLSKVGPTVGPECYPRHIVIRTNASVTVKFNATTEHGITVTAADSPLEWVGEVRNIFITNASGGTAAIKIISRP